MNRLPLVLSRGVAVRSQGARTTALRRLPHFVGNRTLAVASLVGTAPFSSCLTTMRFCSSTGNTGAPGCGAAPGKKMYTQLELVEMSKTAAGAFQEGDYTTAIQNWEAVAASENHADDSPTLMSCLNNLACAYGEIGDNVRKVKLLERSRQLVEKVYGTEHPQYGMVLYNMACAKEEMGLYDEMTQLLVDSLALHEKRFNPNHAKVGRVLLLLASAYDHVGEHEKQLQAAQRAFDIVRRHCGPEHVQTTIAMMTLARAYGSNDQPEKYLQTALAAFDIQEKKLGQLNPQLALTLLDLAGAYAANRDYYNQKEMLERAVSVQQRAFGKQHTYLIDTYIALAEAYDKLGDTATMTHYYNEALKVARSRYQGKHVGIGVAATKAALGALRTGQLKKARALAAEAKDVLAVNVSADHPTAKDLQTVMQELHKLEEEKKASEKPE